MFFTYGLVLATFYDVPDRRTGLHLVVLAASNFLGPVLLGALFDTIGRCVMISLTYAVSGILLIAAAVAFGLGIFSAWTQTFAWMAIFFYAFHGRELRLSHSQRNLLRCETATARRRGQTTLIREAARHLAALHRPYSGRALAGSTGPFAARARIRLEFPWHSSA